MTDDELRAAAERCRDLGEPGWVDVENASAECVADLLILARAYLAEHPADDAELVAEEWLRSVGFWERGDDELVSPPDRSVAADRRGPWRLIYDTDPCPSAGCPQWSLSFPGCQSGLGYDLPTRGAVRRLLTALGITLAPKG